MIYIYTYIHNIHINHKRSWNHQPISPDSSPLHSAFRFADRWRRSLLSVVARPKRRALKIVIFKFNIFQILSVFSVSIWFQCWGFHTDSIFWDGLGRFGMEDDWGIEAIEAVEAVEVQIWVFRRLAMKQEKRSETFSGISLWRSSPVALVVSMARDLHQFSGQIEAEHGIRMKLQELQNCRSMC